MAGFSEPILHGLCTYGYAVRHIQNQFPERTITGVKGRFSSPVLPGETLITKMWEDGEKVLFEVWIKESGKKALSGGFIEFKAAAESSTEENTGAVLLTDTLFNEMSDKVDAATVAKVKGIFKFEIKQDDKGLIKI